MTQRPTGARWATFAIFFSNGFAFGVWAASIPPLKMHLGLSPAGLSYALLAGAIGAVTMMQFAGALVARLGGTGRTVVLSTLCCMLSFALPTLMPGLAALAASLALMGAANGLMDVSMNAHAAAVERQWGAPIMSSFHGGFSLGGLAGNGFGALIIALHMPTPFLMPTAGAVGLLFLALSARHLGVGERPKRGGGAGFQWPSRPLLPLALIGLCCFLIEGAMADWSGVYLTTLGATAAVATVGFGAFSLTMVGGRLIGDFVVHRLGRAAVVRYGAFLAAVGLGLAVLWPTIPAVVVGFALVGMGLANVVPSVFSAGARLGRTPAAGIAAVSTAGYGGMLAGPPLIGAVATGWGLRVGIGVMALAAIVAVGVSFANRQQTQAS